MNCYVAGSRHRASALLIFVHVISIFILIFTLIRSFYTVEWPCYNVNDCAVWLLSWNHITVAILIQISSVSYRRRRLLNCLDEAEALARRCVGQQRHASTKLVRYQLCLISLFVVKTGVALYTRQTNEFVVFILYSISYLIPLSMECMLLLLCSVVENACSEINITLAELAIGNHNVIVLNRRLTSLIDSYQEAANLLNKVSRCFSRDLLVDLAFNMIWFIIYIYVATVALCTAGSSIGRNVCLILELIFLATRVCFLSYSVNRIESEASKNKI